MKTCRDCQNLLPETSFCKKKKNPDGLSYYCRSCSSLRAKKHYHKDGVKTKILTRNKMSVNKARRFVFDYLTNHPCIDCGESRIPCLDFDHQRDKYKNISEMVAQGHSILSIQLEIEKCEVRCANCHRIKTAEQFDWYCGIPGETRTHIEPV